MIAYDTLDALQVQVSKFLNAETYKPIISDRYYVHDLEESLDAKLKAIVEDLDKSHEALLKEDCETSIIGFKKELNNLIERMVALKSQYKEAIDTIKKKDNALIVDAEVSFCERIARAFQSIIISLETWATESLSIEEANKNFFTSAAYSPQDIEIIYNNLVSAGWIEKRRTSCADFLYYFTGEGLRPYNLIRWHKPATWLSLFVNWAVSDTKKWAKASLIFETQDPDSGQWGAVTRKTLSVSYRSINDADYFDEVNQEVLGMFPEEAN